MSTDAQKIVDLEERLVESQRRIQELEQMNTELTQRLDVSDQTIDTSIVSDAALSYNNMALIWDNAILLNQVRNTADIDDLKRREEYLREENNNLKDRIVELENENKGLKERILQLESNNTSLTLRLGTLEDTIRKIHEQEEMDKALLLICDIIAMVKPKINSLRNIFKSLDEDPTILMENPEMIDECAESLSTTSDIIVNLWLMNNQRHATMCTIVRNITDMESLLDRAGKCIDVLSEAQQDAARFIMSEYSKIIEYKKRHLIEA